MPAETAQEEYRGKNIMFDKFTDKANELLGKMTLREKIGQLNQITISAYTDDMDKLCKLIKDGEVGSLILASSATAGNDPQGHVNRELYNKLQKTAVEESRLGIPMIYGRDVIHGHRTVFPLPLASAASFNDALVTECYRDIAIEALGDGIRWTFSPMLDLCHDPRWGRMVEGPGEDPYLGARMAKAIVSGFQGDSLGGKDSIVACAKHYLGYGASEGGRDYARTEISDATLYNYILPAFRAAVDAGVGTFMSSFNDINGIPVTGSRKYLTDILRGKLGFDGFVVSDWEAVIQLKKQGFAANAGECAKIALNAGLDLDMCDRCYIENLESLVNSGEVSVDTVDTAVRRILCVKFAMGLFDSPYGEDKHYDKVKHLKDARDLAAESMVLLKNDGVLPLKSDSNIALAGPFADERRSLLGTWTLDGSADETPSFAEALKEAAVNVTVVDEKNEDKCKDADVIVLAIGEKHYRTGENHSMADISLEEPQRELVRRMRATGKKVVGVFFSARPMAIYDIEENFDAILYAWHCGSMTAHAAADILFGKTVPSGKTPVTFPRRPTHLPLYYNVTSSGRPANGYYGELSQGNYDDGDYAPLYPFGYGLSYTSFEYKDIRISADTIPLSDLKAGKGVDVSVTVRNTGGFDGKETVQLYIRDKAASLMRPIRELKDYKKALIKKGESVKVSFSLGYDKLGFYNESGEYKVEPGEFEIYVGDNCLTENCVAFTVTE